MTPYLIAHKVRGKPAFDVAKRMECPLCARGQRGSDGVMTDCDECDGLGYWWIVPTSGHRARPYWTCEIADLVDYSKYSTMQSGSAPSIVEDLPTMPPSLPDHYSCNAAPEPAKPSGLLKLLGLGRAATQIKRRV